MCPPSTSAARTIAEDASRGAIKDIIPDREFDYQPLNPELDEVRLLNLEPGEWESEIRCKLEHVFLSGAPDYEALSYQWGDATVLHGIRLQNHRHQVTENLQKALRHLRRASEPRVLWIDALCVNQKNLQERSEQVPQMRKIYTQASNVLAWTGVATEDSDEAIDVLERFGAWMEVYGEDIDDIAEGGTDANHLSGSHHEAVRHLGFPVDAQNWKAVWNFLDRSYWTRVWVIQELAVRGTRESAQPCTIICGTRQMEKTLFELAYIGLAILVISGDRNSAISSSGEILEPNRSMLMRGRGHPPGLAMNQTLFAANPPGKQPSLNWLRAVAWRFDATDERDKIFALLGLVADEDKAVKPDYVKSTLDMLKEYVEFYLKRDKSIEFIGANRREPCSISTTWVPELHRHHYAHDMCLNGEHNLRHYNAAGSRPAKAMIEENGKILVVHGKVVGTVKQVIGPWVEGQEDSEAFSDYSEFLSRHTGQEVLRQIRDFIMSTGPEYNDFEAIWRTLVADRPAENPFDDEEPVGLPAPNDMGLMARVFFGLGQIPEDFKPGENPTTRYHAMTRSFQSTTSRRIANRTFLTLEDDKTGLGPYLAVPGDVAVVLYGSRVPFVLRPRSGGLYEVVGTAYVHGVMRGELVGSGDSEEQAFRLC